MLTVQNSLISSVQGWARLLRSPFKFKTFPRETPETQKLKRRERQRRGKLRIKSDWNVPVFAMCCIEAGGGVLYKPKVRQGSSSRNGRREWAFISACSCSWYLIQMCCKCWELLTHERIKSECWVSVESTAIAEKGKKEDSMDLFWLVMIQRSCIGETLVTLLHRWDYQIEWNPLAAVQGTYSDMALEGKRCFWER